VTTAKPTYGVIETSRMRHRVLTEGSGPPVLLLHGFPEGAYSWRHQVSALAAAGYRAIAPEQRGYAGAEVKVPVEGYDHVELALDIVALLDAIGAERAPIVAHDWGAALAWNLALLHPDRVSSVAALSVPFGGRSKGPPIAAFRKMVGEAFFYILYFQKPGVAEAELEADVRESLRRFYYAGGARDAPYGPFPKTARVLETLRAPSSGLPAWLSEEDLQHFTASFEASGFAGPLGWYRSMDRTWERMAPFDGAKIEQPALFMAGSLDPVIMFSRSAMERMPTAISNLSGPKLLEGVGHWIQQERPDDVNREIIAFLGGP
jgi:pimeloyl-ACP methyl ester carboxylesterase